MSKRRFKLYKNLLFSSYHPRSIGSGSYRNYRKFSFCVSRFSHLIFLDYVIVACSKIYHRLLSVIHNGACPAVERSNVVTSNARFFRTVCKSDATTRSAEPQRKDRSSCPFLNYRERSCPHGSAMIEISLISFRWFKLENPLQFSLLKSSFLLAFSTSLTPTSFSRKDSSRCESRRNKRRDSGVQTLFLGRALPRNLRILSIRHESLFGRPQ